MGVLLASALSAAMPAPADDAWQSVVFAPTWVAHPGGLALDGDAVHLALFHGRDGNGEGLAYAYCAANCGSGASWSVVPLLETGKVHPTIRVDAWGRPRIGFWHAGELKYAACDTNCTLAPSWRITTIERVERPDIGGNYEYLIGDFALDGQGRPRFAYPYVQYTEPNLMAQLLKYATCDSACTTTAGWQTTTLMEVSLPATWPYESKLSFDGDKPRVGYWAWDKQVPPGDHNVGYAACDVDCINADNWGHVVVPEPFPNPYGITFAVRGSRAHMAYLNQGSGVYYTTCAQNCLSAASWTAPALIHAQIRPSAPRLVLTSEGLPHIVLISYSEESVPDGRGKMTSGEDPYYLTCGILELCSTAGGWQSQRLDHMGRLVAPHAFALDGSRPRIAYSAWYTSDHVGFTFCDTCGTAGPRPSRPPTTGAPETGPGDPDPSPTPTTTSSPTSSPTASPTSSPTASPTPTGTSGGGGGGDDGGSGGGGGGGSSSSSSSGSSRSGGTPSPSPQPPPSPRPEGAGDPEVSASDTGVNRFSGADRMGTAVAVSRAMFDTAVGWVFVANAAAFPDALAAGPAAGRMGAPVLLVERDKVPDTTAAEIRRLRPERIAVLGGHGAIAPQTELLLATMSREGAVRVAGADRYATATVVSRTWFPPGTKTAFLAAGAGFADALAGGAAAARNASPILLTARDQLPSSTQEELERLKPEEVVILGGPSAVSGRVLAQVQALGIQPYRISGSDRYATAAAVTAETFSQATRVFIATGRDYPDALAAVPAAASKDAPLLLVTADSIPDSIIRELRRLDPGRITLLGGHRAISSKVEASLRQYTQS